VAADAGRGTIPPNGSLSWAASIGSAGRKNWQDLFDSHDLVPYRRETVKIEVSAERDGAFAVVDIDTLWRHKMTGADNHWKGRVCKIYTKTAAGAWKFIFQTGALDYSSVSHGSCRMSRQ